MFKDTQSDTSVEVLNAEVARLVKRDIKRKEMRIQFVFCNLFRKLDRSN